MAWTTPLTAVANTSLTAAQWNASVRDNLLETAAAKATAAGQHMVSTGANTLAARVANVASVLTTETTTQTSFGDHLATSGPEVTVTSGSKALVAVHSRLVNNTAGEHSYAGLVVSGASSVPPADYLSVAYESGSANDNLRASGCWLYTGLTVGSNTFKMQYKVSGGTGSFAERRISIVPF